MSVMVMLLLLGITSSAAPKPICFPDAHRQALDDGGVISIGQKKQGTIAKDAWAENSPPPGYLRAAWWAYWGHDETTRNALGTVAFESVKSNLLSRCAPNRSRGIVHAGSRLGGTGGCHGPMLKMLLLSPQSLPRMPTVCAALMDPVPRVPMHVQASRRGADGVFRSNVAICAHHNMVGVCKGLALGLPVHPCAHAPELSGKVWVWGSRSLLRVMVADGVRAS